MSEDLKLEMEKIHYKLDRIERLLQEIDRKVDESNSDMIKLRNHIDFVEGTYSVVRKPLNFLKKRIDGLMGSSEHGELPLLEGKIEDEY